MVTRISRFPFATEAAKTTKMQNHRKGSVKRSWRVRERATQPRWAGSVVVGGFTLFIDQ